MTCEPCSGTGKITIYQKQTMSSAILTCQRCFGTGQELVGVSYAGIGSRETPLTIIREMENIAMQLALRGYPLRSGAAKPPVKKEPDDTDSADLAFERGCCMVGGRAVIRTYTTQQKAMEIAAYFHPAWDKCSDYARALHARNSTIMLGDYFDDPVRFVVCWTKNGAVVGGTGQALRIAAHYNIPVFNLAVTPAAALWEWLGHG